MLACLTLVWFIAGLIVRYREIGAICSGEYTDSFGIAPYAWLSGSVINYYFLFVMMFAILLCACGSCVLFAGDNSVLRRGV